MKILNKEQRKITFWQYLGVLAIPILLLFFLGFSLGRLGKVDDQSYQEKYNQAQAELDSLNEKFVDLRETVLAVNDHLKDLETVPDLEKVLVDAYTMGDLISQNNASEDLRDLMKTVKRNLEDLEDGLRVAHPMDSIAADFLKIAQWYSNIYNDLRLRKEQNLGLLQERGLVAIMEDQEQQMQEELDALDDQVDELADQVRDVNFEKRQLQAQLDRCREEQGGGPAPVENSPHVEFIRNEIMYITTTLLPEIQAKFLGRGEIGPVKEKIESRLDGVVRELALIE